LKCREEPIAEVLAEKPAVAAEPVLGEPMDILTGLQLVLKKSLAHDGLARGLHEAAKAIEKHAAQLCVLAEDCNQPDYSKLVQALCSEHNVNLISVPSAKKLGEWVGVRLFFLECDILVNLASSQNALWVVCCSDFKV
jgi:small subunit ribosomal protein S12e